MKHLKGLLLIVVFTLSVVGVANAQKIGHIETERLIADMPETKVMQTEMEKMQKTYKDDVAGLAKKLEDKMKKYQAEAESQTNETNEKRAAEVQQDRNRVIQAEQVATQEMQKKYQERITPILEKVQKAIKDVATEKGIVYVFDASAGKGLIIFEKGVDLYDAVKTKLGF